METLKTVGEYQNLTQLPLDVVNSYVSVLERSHVPERGIEVMMKNVIAENTKLSQKSPETQKRYIKGIVDNVIRITEAVKAPGISQQGVIFQR